MRAFTPIAGCARRVDHPPDDGRTPLIYRVRERGRLGDLTVVGPRTRALLKDATGFVYALALHFKPGWSAPLLGVPASGMADAFVSLEDVWGADARDLIGELLDAKRLSDVIACIERARFRHGPRPALRARVRVDRSGVRRICSKAKRCG